MSLLTYEKLKRKARISCSFQILKIKAPAAALCLCPGERGGKKGEYEYKFTPGNSYKSPLLHFIASLE